MLSNCLLVALAACAVNAYDKNVYVSDWTTVTVTMTVTAPTLTQTVSVADQAQLNYETTTLSAAAVETEHSAVCEKPTVIASNSVTSSVTSFISTVKAALVTSTPPPALTTTAAAEVQVAVECSPWTNAWTSTVKTEYTTSATSTRALSASAVVTATAANAYQQAVLYNHNIHRSNHSAPSVDWSADLETSARTLAAKCVYEHDT